MAIALNEVQAGACCAALEVDRALLISAATVAESRIVGARRNVGEEIERLIDGLGFEIVSVTAASARRVAQAYERWGKGVHPAALNFGDCFAYALAEEYRCRLLYAGEASNRTDIEAVL